MEHKPAEYGYSARPPREFAAQRVMVCQSEIEAYVARYPGLDADQVRATMVAYGPLRKEVEERLAAIARELRPR
jgi:hypothetical protein